MLNDLEHFLSSYGCYQDATNIVKDGRISYTYTCIPTTVNTVNPIKIYIKSKNGAVNYADMTYQNSVGLNKWLEYYIDHYKLSYIGNNKWSVFTGEQNYYWTLYKKEFHLILAIVQR
jgi:hypothetical protein